MDPTHSSARRLWNAIEPIHAVVYFDPKPTADLKAVGLRGGWMAYFAGRFAPLGAIGAGPAAAIAYGFDPRMVARALPDAWGLTSPRRVLDVWSGAAGEVLHRDLSGVDEAVVVELEDLLANAVSACRCDGRPLAAGWLDVPVDRDPFTALWLRATALREHRGDGHVAVAVSLGLRGLDAILTHVATGAVTRELMQRNRGWSDDEWDEAVRQLEDRGILGRDGRLTDSGAALRGQLEERTDELAAAPVTQLGRDGVERVIELAVPLSRHVIDSGFVPIPYGVGVPRP